MDNIKVEIENNDEKFELIYSNTFTLIGRKNKISIILPNKFYNWKYNLEFIDDSTKEKLTGNQSFNGNEIFLKFYNWDDYNYIENTEPTILTSADGQLVLYSKLRTISSIENNQRTVIFTIWKKII